LRRYFSVTLTYQSLPLLQNKQDSAEKWPQEESFDCLLKGKMMSGKEQGKGKVEEAEAKGRMKKHSWAMTLKDRPIL